MAAFANALRNASQSTPSATHNAPPPPRFKAPAHKNSHHLHSIPPREKSTRTLIVDHMLWVHARTRFAQARAELGMSDLTGGPSSPNYIHRTRPENYDDDEAALNDDDTSERRQDLSLARTLRLRAEGLEKVVTSMLSQPPPMPPHPNVEPSPQAQAQTPPSTISRTRKTGRHPHILPNGVRLRLALGTIVNDFFARQAPHPPYRHIREASSSSSRSRSRSRSHTESELDVDHDLPYVLYPLTPISGAFREYPPPTEDAEDPEDEPSQPPYQPPPSEYQYRQIGLSPFAAPGSHPHDRVFDMPPPPVPNRPKPRKRLTTKPIPSSRARTLYSAGADASTSAQASPGHRCPRHLYIGCEICVEAKSPTTTGRGSMVIRNTQHDKSTDGGGISGWKDGSGIGTGLLKPDLGGSALRRKVGTEPMHRGREQEKGKSRVDARDESSDGTGAGNTKLGKLIPRFIKLSALVAGELGREVRGEEVDDGDSDEEEDSGDDSDSDEERTQTPTTQRSTSKPRGSRAHRQMYDTALQPTSEWYQLLEGLLTRAIVEGYLTAGWRGIGAVECLSLVGVGVDRPREQGFNLDGVWDAEDIEDEEDAIFEEVEPDEYPSLSEAVKVLFPSLRYSQTGKKKGDAEREYEEEMFERLRKFYDIPESTPDLSTHMEDMAWHFPAEPVERAAVRFCEAIAEWRGKPELEMYKNNRKSPPRVTVSTHSRSASATTLLPMESLVHSNPTSPVTAHREPANLGSLSAHVEASFNASVAGNKGKRRRGNGQPAIGIYFSSASGTSASTNTSPAAKSTKETLPTPTSPTPSSAPASAAAPAPTPGHTPALIAPVIAGGVGMSIGSAAAASIPRSYTTHVQHQHQHPTTYNGSVLIGGWMPPTTSTTASALSHAYASAHQHQYRTGQHLGHSHTQSHAQIAQANQQQQQASQSGKRERPEDEYDRYGSKRVRM